ncbi:hypothetical protein L6164_008284 [Bauhinia variegata]|uniref:Uncharacterized protein n=1 Tax=Bauhinia variegata TaxID=167791 RepID=A0ACB9PF94_BAUVA|nr:hypothetical protein L6164_008284 [Bauhinia variegata]
MSEHKTQAICTDDPYQPPQIVANPDGTFTRLGMDKFPIIPAKPDLDDDDPSTVLTKDLTLNPNTKTWVRIFLPRKALDQNSSSFTKLPLIVYYHGGGFVYPGPSTSLAHAFCCKLAEFLPAVIVSVGYRLSPENRLPAAYDNGVEALNWLKATDEEWVREYADVSNVYLMGSSSGGNLAYHVGLRVSLEVDGYDPLKIQGLILHYPFFGGSQRTGSEIRFVNDEILPLSSADKMWELALPIGADRDHEYCNPTVMLNDGSRAKPLDEIKRLGWRILVKGVHGDPLIDREMEFAQMLKSRGIRVAEHYSEGYHGHDLLEPTKAETMFQVTKEFLRN